MKIGMLWKSRKIASLGAMLGVAACTVIGGSLYNLRQNAAEQARIEAEAAAEAERLRLEAEEAARIPELSQSQIELLNQIENAIEEDDLEAAAELMIDHGERLWVLYHDVLGGEMYLFCEGKLFKEIEGTGLVLRKPSTIFYGSFSEGRPEGEGTALQVIELDHPRYDYSVGNWKSGQMDGEGIVGYHYYEGSGDENKAVSRKGLFAQDKMEGKVTYSTTNAEDTIATWDMTVKGGQLVLDSSWTYDKEKKIYQLLTNESGGHAFVTGEDAAKSMMFQNMIPWE